MNAVRLALACVVSTAAVGTVVWLTMPAAKPQVRTRLPPVQLLPPPGPVRPYTRPTIIDTHPTRSLDVEVYPDKDALLYLRPRR